MQQECLRRSWGVEAEFLAQKWSRGSANTKWKVFLKVKINAISLIFCRVGSDFLSLLLFVGISRHFGPAGVGEFSYGFAIATLVFVIASLGMDTYGVRHFLQLAPHERSAWMAELLGTQVVMSLISVAGLGGYLLLTGPTPAKLAVILALTTYQVLVALARTMFIPAIARERMVFPAIVDVMSRVVAVGVAIMAIAWSSASVAVALLGFPVAGALFLIVAAISAVRYGIKLRIRISRKALQGIGRTLWAYAAAEVVAQIFMRLGLVILAILAGEVATGLYAAGLKLLELSCVPLVYVGVAAYPRLVFLHETDMPLFRKLANNLLWIMVLMSGGIGWGLYYVAPEIIIPILGSKFAGTESIVRAMSAVAVLQAVEAILWPMLLAAGLQAERLVVIIIATLASLVLNLALIPRFGVYGAIAASLLSLMIVVVLFVAVLRRALVPQLLARPFLILISGVAVAASSAWLLRYQGIWVEAAISIAAFLAVVGLGYRRQRANEVMAVPG